MSKGKSITWKYHLQLSEYNSPPPPPDPLPPSANNNIVGTFISFDFALAKSKPCIPTPADIWPNLGSLFEGIPNLATEVDFHTKRLTSLDCNHNLTLSGVICGNKYTFRETNFFNESNFALSPLHKLLFTLHSILYGAIFY